MEYKFNFCKQSLIYIYFLAFPMYVQVEGPSNIVENERDIMPLRDIRRSVRIPRRLVLRIK